MVAGETGSTQTQFHTEFPEEGGCQKNPPDVAPASAGLFTGTASEYVESGFSRTFFESGFIRTVFASGLQPGTRCRTRGVDVRRMLPIVRSQ